MYWFISESTSSQYCNTYLANLCRIILQALLVSSYFECLSLSYDLLIPSKAVVLYLSGEGRRKNTHRSKSAGGSRAVSLREVQNLTLLSLYVCISVAGVHVASLM